MMELLSQHKMLAIAAIIAFAIGLWYVLSGGTSAPNDSLLSSKPASADPASAGVIEVLLALRSIKLDGAIFSEPAFGALRDFSTQITPEPVGRPNPFAPLAHESRPTTDTTKAAGIFTKPSAPSGKSAKH